MTFNKIIIIWIAGYIHLARNRTFEQKDSNMNFTFFAWTTQVEKKMNKCIIPEWTYRSREKDSKLCLKKKNKNRNKSQEIP